MNKKAGLLEIFNIYFIIGIQLLGGGYVIVPLLKKYVVEDKKWLTEEELVDYFAMSQCIPGIIAGNIAICSGYKVRGMSGALMSILGIITPSFLCILILAHIMSNIVGFQIVQNAFWGIRISVIILIFITVKDLWKKSVNSFFTYLLFIIVLLAFFILPVSPAIIIIISAISAIIYTTVKGKKNV
ncbi:MAG: chromate transporter [Candidatus Gastranaerophilales bacterium]|nr:chromate transporter [Candidatus Gastranaerophilales bacterium]